MKLIKTYDNVCKVMVEPRVVECGELRERVASLTNDSKIKSSEVRNMQNLVEEASRFRQELSEERKEIGSCAHN